MLETSDHIFWCSPCSRSFWRILAHMNVLAPTTTPHMLGGHWLSYREGLILTKGVQSTTNYGVLRPTQSAIRSNSFQVRASLINGIQRSKSSLESLFCYDKPVPEEKIEKPVGTSLSKKEIGNKPPCINCHVKGAVLCTTCNGSDLYVDSILESQGITVKVRCLGCGVTGNIMGSKCGGRGHMGSD